MSKKKTLSSEDKEQIVECIRRIEQLFRTDIFEAHNYRHPLVRSAFIDLIICLDDLMSKAGYYCSRIVFNDDVFDTTKIQPKTKKQVADVTDLINFVRNAVCHINEDNRIHVGRTVEGSEKVRQGAGVAFNRCIGKGNAFGAICKYDDDQVFAFGEHNIYLNRHIKRAFEEARHILVEAYPEIFPAEAVLRKIKNFPIATPRYIDKEHILIEKVKDSPFQSVVDERLSLLRKKAKK